MCFSSPQYGGLDPHKEGMTPELMKKQMTEAEWLKVYEMSKDKNLYHNLCSSLFPTIYGPLFSTSVCIFFLTMPGSARPRS